MSLGDSDGPSAQATILVVEDDPMAHDLIVQLLEEAGYQVLSAFEGVAALEIARSHTPDLVVLDIMMPRMEGREVCRLLRASMSTRSTPVIFLSAVDSLEERLQAFEAGGNDFVSKPFDEAQFLEKVRGLLRLASTRASMVG